jgi:hypothetical protein
VVEVAESLRGNVRFEQSLELRHSWATIARTRVFGLTTGRRPLRRRALGLECHAMGVRAKSQRAARAAPRSFLHPGGRGSGCVQ